MKILLFGPLQDIAGAAYCELESVTDIESLKIQLTTKYPAFAQQKYVIAVDKEITQSNSSLTDKSEIALLPPFSGG